MTPNDERLRLAYGDALAHRRQIDRAACPEPEALLAVAARSGSEAVRLQVLDHVMQCDRCRREFDLVRASVMATGAPRQRSWFRSPSIGLMAIAALLLIAAGVRLYGTSRDLEAGPRLRGGAAAWAYPARWLSTVGVGLAWRPTVGAVAYRVEVVDETGRAVIDSTMRDTSLFVNDSLLRGHRELVWTVAATLGDGTSVNSLPVRLVPPAR